MTIFISYPFYIIPSPLVYLLSEREESGSKCKELLPTLPRLIIAPAPSRQLIFIARACWWIKGWLYLKPPKFEHIFVAVITFFPFLLCKYFWYQLVAYCVCLKMPWEEVGSKNYHLKAHTISNKLVSKVFAQKKGEKKLWQLQICVQISVVSGVVTP